MILCKLFFIFCLFNLSLFYLPANGAELTEMHTSVRALGMGNAYSAVVSDADALFYNPAALSKISGYNFRFLDLQIGLNGLEAYDNAIKASEAEGIEGFNELYGTKIWGGLGAKSAIFVPNFALALYDSGLVSAELNDPAYPSLTTDFINDYGIAIGLSFGMGELWSMGFVAKRITRTGQSIPIEPGILIDGGGDLASEFENTGIGYGLDFGTQITLPAPVKPTFTFVWKNVGHTSFQATGVHSAPPKMRDEMLLGFAADIDLFFATLTPSIDYKHITQYDEPIGKKLHLGAELSLPLVRVRGGFHQGYYTLGLGIDFWLIRFDIASYGVEKGIYPGQDEDRRFAAQLTIELGFDPMSFNFLGQGSGGGTRGRLKQRR